MFEKTDIPIWEHPPYYSGHSPDGDYVIYSRHRDSNLLENSNYECILRELQQADKNKKYVYDFRANHWGFGWVEYIIVRKAAPDHITNLVCEILGALSDYPILDESDYSEREYNYICDHWQGLSLQEKIELCKEHNISIFSARKNNPFEISDIDNMLEWLLMGS